jgi:hypothetical protein
MASEVLIPGDKFGLSNEEMWPEFEERVLKIIVYTDSLSCNTCKVDNLFQYSDIVNFCKQLDGKCEPVFMFSPRERDVEMLRYRLDISIIDYNIVIDSTRSFPKANPHIPADSRLHTFLLDKNGKVVLVGDPSHNPELWELYKKTITELVENNGTPAQ